MNVEGRIRNHQHDTFARLRATKAVLMFWGELRVGAHRQSHGGATLHLHDGLTFEDHDLLGRRMPMPRRDAARRQLRQESRWAGGEITPQISHFVALSRSWYGLEVSL